MSSSDLLLTPVEDASARENFRRLRLLLQQINEQLAELDGREGGGASTYLELTDTPKDYKGVGNAIPVAIATKRSDNAGNIPRVTQEGDALEFIDPITVRQEGGSSSVTGRASNTQAVTSGGNFFPTIPFANQVTSITFNVALQETSTGARTIITHLNGHQLQTEILLAEGPPPPASKTITGISLDVVGDNVLIDGTSDTTVTFAEGDGRVTVTGLGTNNVQVSVALVVTNDNVGVMSSFSVANLVAIFDGGMTAPLSLGPMDWLLPNLIFTAFLRGAGARASFRETFDTIGYNYTFHRPVTFENLTLAGAPNTAAPGNPAPDATPNSLTTDRRSGAITLARADVVDYTSSGLTLSLTAVFRSFTGNNHRVTRSVNINFPTTTYDVWIATQPRAMAAWTQAQFDAAFIPLASAPSIADIDELHNKEIRFETVGGRVQRLIAIRDSFLTELRARTPEQGLFFTTSLGQRVPISDLSTRRATIDIMGGDGSAVTYGIYRVNASASALVSPLTIENRR